MVKNHFVTCGCLREKGLPIKVHYIVVNVYKTLSFMYDCNQSKAMLPQHNVQPHTGFNQNHSAEKVVACIMAAFILRTNSSNDCRTGRRNELLQVCAYGNSAVWSSLSSSRWPKIIVGCGSNPSDGISSEPVANISNSLSCSVAASQQA